MSPAKAVLAATFGRGGQQPAQAAVWRLAVIFIATCSVSCAGYFSLNNLPLRPLEHPQSLILPALLAFQAVALAGLLATLGIAGPTNHDRLLRLFAALPLTDRILWQLSYLPQFTLTGFALLLSAGPLGHILLALGLHPISLLLCTIGGTISAFGVLYGLSPTRPRIALLLLPALAYGEYKLASIGLQSNNLNDRLIATATLLAGCCVLGIRFFASQYIRRVLARNAPLRQINTLRTTLGYWYAKKLLRHNGMRLGLITTFGMSSGLAIVLHMSELPLAGIAPTAVALLIAAYSSDARSVLRRHCPLEISGLKGTYYFFASQAVAVCTLGLLAVAPLALVAVSQDIPVRQFVIFSISGVTTGLFASTLIIPMCRDITSQIVTVLLCLLVLVALPRFAPFWQTHASIAVPCTSLILLIAALGIEYKRNTFAWRTYDT